PVIDFGCGTGRASLRLKEAGYEAILVDFADNCRDEEAMSLPFLEWDLSQRCPLKAPYGLCTDVMEHIPLDDVPAVIKSIMNSAGKVLFQISTVPDKFGALVGATLHNTVREHQWWSEMLSCLGFLVEMERQGPVSSIFIVTATPN
ncbi:MAG: methyltransferase domain-containing protein, partial [bacterium]